MQICRTATFLSTAISLIALLAMPTPIRADVTLVRDGKPLATIYVAGPLLDEAAATGGAGAKKQPRRAVPEADDARARALAVRELNYHIKKMTGAEPARRRHRQGRRHHRPGHRARQPGGATGRQAGQDHRIPEGFRLLVKDQLVLIGGQERRGRRLWRRRVAQPPGLRLGYARGDRRDHPAPLHPHRGRGRRLPGARLPAPLPLVSRLRQQGVPRKTRGGRPLLPVDAPLPLRGIFSPDHADRRPRVGRLHQQAQGGVPERPDHVRPPQRKRRQARTRRAADRNHPPA